MTTAARSPGTLLTGVIVAVSGVIGFVGLMPPHCVRLLVGPDHRRVLPVDPHRAAGLHDADAQRPPRAEGS